MSNTTDTTRALSALQAIPPDLPRDQWVKAGMGAHASGLTLEDFDSWSAGAGAPVYDQAAVREVWRSFKDSPAGVGPGSLIHMAKQHGWADTGNHHRPSQEELAKRQEQAAASQAEIAKEQAQAAAWAAAIIEVATPATVDTPYLERKGLQTIGDLYEIDAQQAAQILEYHPYAQGKPLQGRLLVVPIMRDGKVCSLELIDGSKLKAGLKGRNTKTGGYWATDRIPETVTNVAICEGVADAITIRMAGAELAVAAFSDSNLVKVAQEMHRFFPGAVLTIVADLEKDSGRPDPHAITAARAVGGLLAVPNFGPGREPHHKDIDDLRAVFGIEAVRRCLAEAQPVVDDPRETEKDKHQADEDGGANTAPEHKPVELLNSALVRLKDDVGVQSEPEVVQAFATLRANDTANFLRFREKFKSTNRAVSVKLLDEQVRELLPGSGNDQNDATTLVNLASERCQLWHDKEKNAYATMQRTDSDKRSHFEHWAIESTGFKEWLSWLAHTEMGKAPSNETLSAARNALQGKAKFEGEEHQPFKRVAKDENGYWIDLCDDQWNAILVTASGWKIYDKPSVRFIRTKAMRPLPTPLAGGNVDLLWDLVNIPKEERQLVLAWILEAYRCDTPYAVLELIGEEGSAKSSTQRRLRELIDPNQVALRGKPKAVEDVYVAASNNHLVSLENLSGITSYISDALCTIATGGGAASRTFYTNGEESILEVHNPVVLNGIGAVITRNDLLDRAIALCLPTIHDRRTEDDLNAQFEQQAPSIFGGLLDLFSGALVNLVNVKINPSDLPRMADFAILGEAMSMAQGHKPGTWLKLYKEHRKDATRRTIDSSPVAVQCMEFVFAGGSHDGTVKSLLEKLTARMDAKNLEHGEYWPRSPKGFADSLRRVAPALRRLGILASVETKAKMNGVHCHLKKAPEQPDEHGAAGDMHARATPHNRISSSSSSSSSCETDEKEEFEL